MLTMNVPAGTNVDAFARLLVEAGIRTSITVEGGVASFAELEEADRAAVTAVWDTYQQRAADRKAVVDALNANQTYLAITGPTNAQVVAQVRALTQQINGLVKILNRRDVLD